MPELPPHRFSRIAEDLIGDLRRLPGAEPRRQKLRASKPLAEVVDSLVTQFQIGRAAPEDAIRERWTQIVGAANAAYSHPTRLERNGTALVVIAGHSVVRHELFLHRQSIVEKLKQVPGCGGIKFLTLRAG